MRRLSTGQYFEVAFWLGFAGLAYALSFQFDRQVEMYKFGASGWPRVVILLIVVAVLGQLIQDLRRGDTVQAPGVTSMGAGYFSRIIADQGWDFFLRMGAALVLPLVYAGLLEYTGYYFTTPFFLAAYLYISGERRVKWLIVAPLLIYVVLTILFTRFLYVGLPVGYWPGFYDFSNWLIVLIRSG